MRNLRLVGLSADGRTVVFVDDTGVEFATPADDRLRAAMRGDRVRLGQLEIDMESALRPRDIQARVRAGETPAAVAVLAQVSVDKIMPYCVPVLAERQHVAELAQRSHVRRKNVEGPSRRLTDVVRERLLSRGVDARGAEWDAWRRDDGRWWVQTTYQSGEREHTATFVFDAIGRYVVADDDEAKWLTGEQQRTRKGPQPRATATGESGRSRRLASVPADDLLSFDPDETTDDLTAVVRAVSEGDVGPDRQTSPSHEGRVEPGVETSAGPAGVISDPTSEATTGEQALEDPAPSDSADPPKIDTEKPDRKRRATRRASVPSWDEIMFGKGKGD